MPLINDNYDPDDFLLTKIAAESPTFKSYLLSMLKDTDQDYPTNTVWLGTLLKGDKPAQVTLRVTQELINFVDED